MCSLALVFPRSVEPGFRYSCWLLRGLPIQVRSTVVYVGNGVWHVADVVYVGNCV